MEVDNSITDGDSVSVKKVSTNGINNGYISTSENKHNKSEHKDKHRDKHRDKDSSSSSKHRSSSSNHKSSSSSSKDKHSISSSSSNNKDRHNNSSSHKSSSSSSSNNKEIKDRHHHSKDNNKKSSSSTTTSNSKDHHKSSSKDKEKDHHHKSTSSSSSKDKSSRGEKDRKHSSSNSSSNKEKSSHRDNNKEKDRHHHHSNSSSSKDRTTKKDHHHHDNKDHRNNKERSSNKKDSTSTTDELIEIDQQQQKSNKIKEEKIIKEINHHQIPPPPQQQQQNDSSIKREEESSDDDDDDDDDEGKLVIKDEPSSQDENECGNNISQASSCDYNYSHFDRNEADFTDDEDQVESEFHDDDFKPIKDEDDSEEDVPLSSRLSKGKRKFSDNEDDEDDVPLTARKKIKKEEKKRKKKLDSDIDEDEDDFKSSQKKKKIKKEKIKEEIKQEFSPKKGGRKKKEEEENDVWKWWEEEKKEDGVKWSFLEHKGPVFAPPYEPLPNNVKFYYNGDEMKLSSEAEEIAGFYAKMLDHDYTTKDAFNKNFFHDWRESMTSKERSRITDLKKCNFKQLHTYFLDLSEKNRNKTKEEKLSLKEKNEALIKEYGFCTIDGHKEKIGNFKIEPPGLFRGRGEHPRMGKLKKRVEAEDIIINCSKNSKIPQAPPGHKWKEIRHDNKVTWLASWTENVQNQVKYIMLNPSSKLKGEKDWQKYEIARKLHQLVDKIRENYQADWKSKEMKIRQRAVALYFIDKLALRAGNEKDEDQADTVGCCSLRCEHIELQEEKDGRNYVVVFDFLGKDSIRYYNEVPVEKRVFKNLQLFMENKKKGDDLFDRLNTQIMNKHLNDLMEGLTAKVFRTYNASWTLQQQLDELTSPDDSVAEKILAYNRANRAVAVLCNHQRSVPKGHQKSMEKLKEKIDGKRDQIKDAERQVKDAQREAKHGSVKEKMVLDKKKKTLERLRDQLAKLEIQETDRDENKTIALGTSKLNYLDPRISVAWCKKYNVPVEKIYNKTQRAKFRWAIDMAGPDYRFDKIK